MIKQDHIMYQSSSAINGICAPLFSAFNLNYLRYMRIFSDNTRIILSSDPHWTEHFFKNRFYTIAWFDNKPYDYYEQGINLWKIKASKEDNQVGTDSREMFDMYHGMTVVKRHKNFTEFVDFTAPSGNINTDEIFTTKINIFNHFLLYFKDKAVNIINDANKAKIVLPRVFNSKVIKAVDSFNNIEGELLKKIAVKKYYLTNDVKLSARQVSCIKLAHEGLSINQIANKLFLAERTVETHLQNIKYILGCKKREDVIRILIKEGVIDAHV